MNKYEKAEAIRVARQWRRVLMVKRRTFVLRQVKQLLLTLGHDGDFRVRTNFGFTKELNSFGGPKGSGAWRWTCRNCNASISLFPNGPRNTWEFNQWWPHVPHRWDGPDSPTFSIPFVMYNTYDVTQYKNPQYHHLWCKRLTNLL